MAGGDEAYFLDTSTQISKTWEDDNIRGYLNKQLSQKTCYSSIYVKNEYKLKVINDAILVHRVIVGSVTLDIAKQRLDDIMKRMGRGPNDLPYKVFRRLFNQYSRKKPCLTYLEKIIEKTWEHFFIGSLKTTLICLVKCNSAEENPYKQEERYLPITSKCSMGCEIDEFLKSQQDNLNIIANIDITKHGIKDHHRGHFNEMKSISFNIMKGESAHGKTCRDISDAVISMEAKAINPRFIFHSMDSHFKILCDVLNITKCVNTRNEILKKIQR